MKSGGPLARNTPLARTTSLGRTSTLARGGRLNPVSDKMKVQQAEQGKAYSAAADAGAEWCAVCGRAGAVEHSHLYSQGIHKQHRNNPLNWLQSCRVCHDLFEHNKALFAARWPDVWAEIIRRMRAIDLKAYDFYAATNPLLYPDE